jgi:hypothetical protein
LVISQSFETNNILYLTLIDLSLFLGDSRCLERTNEENTELTFNHLFPGLVFVIQYLLKIRDLKQWHELYHTDLMQHDAARKKDDVIHSIIQLLKFVVLVLKTGQQRSWLDNEIRMNYLWNYEVIITRDILDALLIF